MGSHRRLYLVQIQLSHATSCFSERSRHVSSSCLAFIGPTPPPVVLDPPTTGVDLKEWCRRISRALSSAADHDAGLAHHGAGGAAAAGPTFAIAAPAPQSRGGTLPGGYNAVAGFNALGFGGGSSDDSDSAAGGGGDSSGTDNAFHDKGSSSGSSSDGESSDSDGSSGSSSSSGGAARRGPGQAPAVAGGSSSDDSDAGRRERSNAAHGASSGGAGGSKKEGALSPRATARAKRKAAKEKEAEDIARRNLIVGNPEASSGAWGYPFTGPRARTLFISRRSRRHRLMRWHLAAALAANRVDAADAVAGSALTLAAVGSTDDTGPVFSASSGFRLDKRTFWDSLLAGSGATSSWQELTGPNDPLMLSGCYTLANQGGSELLVSLRAYNRWGPLRACGSLDSWGGWLSGVLVWLNAASRCRHGLCLVWRAVLSQPDCQTVACIALGNIYPTIAPDPAWPPFPPPKRLAMDVEDVQVAVRLVGPVRPERREITWQVPRLLPTEAATHQFKLLPTGYGRIELHARIVLPVGGEATVPALRCRPLAISMARSLRVPRGLVPGPHGFLEAWVGLPVSAELPVVATWPGVDGLLLALSALARQPLRCAWQRALPAVCGAQAAYLSAPAAAPNESVAVVVTLQLMPPAGWDPEAGGSGGARRASEAASGAGSDADGAEGSGDEDGGGKAAARSAGDAPSPAESARQLCRGMRAVGHVQLRSSSHEVVLAVRDHSAAWVHDLAQGTLALGITSPPVAPSDKPLLHPSVARLARYFEAAPPAVPLPPQVPEPEMPEPPEFQKRCGRGHKGCACLAAACTCASLLGTLVQPFDPDACMR